MGKNISKTIEQLIVGKSSAIRNIRKAVEKLINNKKNLLIIGPRAVGKTNIARAIHNLTTPNGDIRIISSSSFAEHDLADITSIEGGTIIIKEFENFSLFQQTLLTKFINEKKENKSIRIVATIKSRVKELYSNGKISDETKKLLEGFEQIEVPPLDERPEDIPPLVEHFTKTTCEVLGIRLKALDVNTIDLLTKRGWPGNVGELKSVLENAILSAQGETLEIPISMLDEHSQLNMIVKRIGERQKFPFDKALENLEKKLIERTLETMGYNQTKAAKVLGISGANFRYRLRKYQIKRRPSGT